MLTGPKMLVLSHKEIWTNLLSSGIPILNSSKSILILRFVCELIYYARTSDFKFSFYSRIVDSWNSLLSGV